MSVHHAPVHRPFHPSEHRLLMTFLTLALLAVMIVAIAAIASTYSAPTSVNTSLTAEQARLEFRRGEWSPERYVAPLTPALAEQARLEFRRGEWYGR